MNDTSIIRIGVAARLCGVCEQTIRRAIDAGQIAGFRVPGSGGHRRVYVDSLVAFMDRHGIRVPAELREEAAK